MRESLIDSVREPFRALVETFVPESTSLSPEAWARGESIVEDMLARRPTGMRHQVRWLIRALDAYARLRCGHPLSRLAPDRRSELLRSMQASRVLVLRRGIWGIRTLAFLLFYGRPEVHPLIGYRATADGWRARPDRPPVPEEEPLRKPRAYREPPPDPPPADEPAGAP